MNVQDPDLQQPDLQQPGLQQKVTLSRTLTLISFMALLIGLTGSILVSNTAPILLFPALLPLLIFLPGVLNSNPRGLILLCFVSLLYFFVITVNVFEPDRTLYDILALIAVIVLFIVAMFFSRWQKQLIQQESKS
jgi:uncharacterized membrane protein